MPGLANPQLPAEPHRTTPTGHLVSGEGAPDSRLLLLFFLFLFCFALLLSTPLQTHLLASFRPRGNKHQPPNVTWMSPHRVLLESLRRAGPLAGGFRRLYAPPLIPPGPGTRKKIRDVAFFSGGCRTPELLVGGAGAAQATNFLRRPLGGGRGVPLTRRWAGAGGRMARCEVNPTSVPGGAYDGGRGEKRRPAITKKKKKKPAFRVENAPPCLQVGIVRPVGAMPKAGVQRTC